MVYYRLHNLRYHLRLCQKKYVADMDIEKKGT